MTNYPIDISFKPYKGDQVTFKVEILTYALESLIESTHDALGVYELFSMCRVGDVWKYFWLRPVELPPRLQERYQHAREKAIIPNQRTHPWPNDQIPFLTFDDWFYWNYDIDQEDEAWLYLRNGDELKAFVESCHAQIQQAQIALRSSDDVLIRNAIKLLDAGKHKYDYAPNIPFNRSRNDVEIHSSHSHRHSENYYRKLIEVLAMPEIKSVAYRDGNDFQTIRLCCNEQVSRVHEHGLSVDDYKICAIGNMKVDVASWGAEVLFYEEGLGDGDLFIQQENDYGTPVKQLIEVYRRRHPAYIICIKDEGEITGYQREIGNGWVLYRAQSDASDLPVINTNDKLANQIAQAAKLIADADAILITAGAGMGVDSGLPDFRGDEGFWSAYPALAKTNVKFYEIANPSNFERNPKLAWGFYGHRLNLYRNTKPHAGFRMLRELAATKEHGCFVFTSNVDGHFRKAGFDPRRICECHGSIHHLQCINGCLHHIWDAGEFFPEVDEVQCQLMNEPPKCSCCGGIARPNILMFNDFKWEDNRFKMQRQALSEWLARTKRVVIIELGAGKDIPTVRHYGEMLGWPLIRINPRDSELGSSQGVSLPMSALAGLNALYSALK